MTISSTNRKAGPFIGNGSASTFAFTFRVFQASDLEVVQIATATGIETTLVINSGYTVALNADQNNNPGGSITLVGGALASGQNLIITSNIANLQPTDLTNQGGFYPEVITDALDRATIQLQQLDEHVARTLSYPITDPVIGLELPAFEQRKGMVLAFDETTGAPIVGPDIAAVGTAVANAANINTVANNIGSVNITATNVASVNNFSSVYLGARASDPSTRTNGSALQAGDMYFNTAQNRMKAWGGAAWYNTETAGATSANLVTSTPSGFIGSSNVQAAIYEIASDIAATSGAGLMGATATGYVTGSTVQTAINQIVANTPVSAWDSIKIRMRLGRVDFVGVGDSNQLFNGYGWDSGIPYGLNQFAPMWATGLVSQNEANGAGNAQGFGYTRFGALMGAVSGAPAGLDKYLNKGSGGLSPAYYTFVADGSSIVNNFGCGLILSAGCAIDNGAALSFDIHYGTFDTGSGEFRASVRLEESPYSLLASNSIRSTNTGAIGMAIETISLTADSSRASKAISVKPISTNVTGITGPYFNTYYRARNPSRTAGWSYGTLDYRGGQSLRTMAYDIQQATDDTLTHYFGILRNDQGATPKTIVVCVNSGLNDRNETLASVGPNPTTPGDSAAAFVDNFTALRNRLNALWTANGWDLNELYFLIYVSHPISNPDDSEMVSYRTAIFNYARTLPRTQIISLTDLTSATEMTANNWYVSAGDKNHLSTAGYQQLGTRIVGALQ